MENNVFLGRHDVRSSEENMIDKNGKV